MSVDRQYVRARTLENVNAGKRAVDRLMVITREFERREQGREKLVAERGELIREALKVYSGKTVGNLLGVGKSRVYTMVKQAERHG